MYIIITYNLKYDVLVLNLPTARNTSSAPNAAATNTPMKLRNGKLYSYIGIS